MKYRNVGKAGIKVSEIALGSWMTDLRETAQEDTAKEIIRLAYENGINFLTAQMHIPMELLKYSLEMYLMNIQEKIS